MRDAAAGDKAAVSAARDGALPARGARRDGAHMLIEAGREYACGVCVWASVHSPPGWNKGGGVCVVPTCVVHVVYEGTHKCHKVPELYHVGINEGTGWQAGHVVPQCKGNGGVIVGVVPPTNPQAHRTHEGGEVCVVNWVCVVWWGVWGGVKVGMTPP